MWSERNSHVHGDTPQNQRFIKRKKVLEKAREKYLEGQDTVSINQQRLFINFEK